MATPTSEEVRDLTEKFWGIINNPEPGIFSWHDARTRLGLDLYKMLRQVLPKDEIKKIDVAVKV